MPNPHLSILSDPAVRAALKQAWIDSQPGEVGGHEEGGFILRETAGTLRVERWPRGAQNTILVPPHEDCKIGADEIVASFHTHPNTSADFLQEPSETDKRAVRDDPHLKSAGYVGEFVISQATIFLITAQGRVRELSDTDEVLAET